MNSTSYKKNWRNWKSFLYFRIAILQSWISILQNWNYILFTCMKMVSTWIKWKFIIGRMKFSLIVQYSRYYEQESLEPMPVQFHRNIAPTRRRLICQKTLIDVKDAFPIYAYTILERASTTIRSIYETSNNFFWGSCWDNYTNYIGTLLFFGQKSLCLKYMLGQ